MDKSKIEIFSARGVLKDKETVECEEAIYEEVLKLMKSYKKRKVPLIEVRAVIQCLIGSVNEAVLIYLKQKF